MKKLSCLVLSLFCLNAYAQDYSNLYISNSLDLAANELIKNKKDQILPAVSADKISDDYSKNELSANRKYKEKVIRVTGTIDSIEEDIFGSAFIALKAKNSLFGVKLNLKHVNEEIYELSKGEQLDMTCIGGGYSVQVPVFNKCIFTKDYINASFEEVKKNLNNYQSEKYKPFSKYEIFILYYVEGNNNLINDYCHKDNKCSLLGMEEFIKNRKLNEEEINNKAKERFVDPMNAKFGVDYLKNLPMINFIEL